MPTPKTNPAETPGCLQIVKGELPPLNPEQRRLVEIFVWYLRGLPDWDDKRSWDSEEYELVGKLLLRFFRDKNPRWSRNPSSHVFEIDDLPECDGDEFSNLMFYAANDPHPQIGRLKKLFAT